MSEQTLPYDKKSKDSILEHAQRMLGKTLWEMYGEARLLDTGKGSLGNAVEKYHFQYEPNSKSEPDFKEAGVELKCTPLKKASDGSMLSKERLVLNVIDYIEEATKTFDTSSFWKKNALLLLMFYLHEDGKLPYDLIFKIVRYWNFPETDLKIIRDDWTIIHNKILAGKAHEISEGDTPHDIYNIRNPENILLSEACCNSCRPSSETSVPPCRPLPPAPKRNTGLSRYIP